MTSPLQAEPLQVSIGELDSAIEALDGEPDALQRLVLQKIRDELSAADLTLHEGELLFSDSASNLLSSNSCNHTEVRTLETSVTLASDTQVSLSLESLHEPISLRLELDALIHAQGRAKQVYGVRIGSCRELGSDNFDFQASGHASLSLELVLSLNPELQIDRQRLLMRPEITLDGNLIRQNIRVDVEGSLLRAVLEGVLEDEIDDALGRDEIVAIVNQLEFELLDTLSAELDNGLLIVDLPDPSDEQLGHLYRWLSPDSGFSLAPGYLRSHRLELLAALILGDGEVLQSLLGNAVQCEAASILQVPLAHRPLHRVDDAGCSAVQMADYTLGLDEAQAVDLINGETWYNDTDCQSPVDFSASSAAGFCHAALDTQRLGNAASLSDELLQWTLSPSTRFDIGAVPLADALQPFTQRVNYKSVATDMGQCELEMRIHAPLPSGRDGQPGTDTGLRPLIAFHGGSWQHRFAGTLGLESFATQLVNQGFVVFAPFYRLIGDSDGPMECNGANLEQVLADSSDALTWVLHNASRYGASGKPVVFGQSAGGHLAGVLAVERAAEIASAVLFYAPVDFADFARQLLRGELEATSDGQQILEDVLGQRLETLDISSALIQRNSLPGRIVSDLAASPPKPLPPFFLLHGQSDTVLPYQQSVRLCNALSGIPLDSSVPGPSALAELRQNLRCGSAGSQLHLIAEGEHALDLCLADELCLAGSPASAALTRDSIEQMLDWVNTVAPVHESGEQAQDDETGLSRGGNADERVLTSGGGALAPAILAGLLLLRVGRWQMRRRGQTAI